MTYTLHPAAEQDVAEILDFYVEHASRAVAARFLREFERVANLVGEQPGLGTPKSSARRAMPLRVFPYLVVYRPLASGGARILVVRHQHRRPGYGGGRG